MDNLNRALPKKIIDIMQSKTVVLPDIGAPINLYKYRSWCKKKDSPDDKVIVDNELWFSSARNFSDRNDAKFRFRYDLMSLQDCINRAYHLSYLDAPEMIGTDRICRAQKFGGKTYERFRTPNEVALANQNLTGNAIDTFGILSTCTIPDSYKMWQEYGDNFKGICVGFNVETLIGDLNKNGIRCNIMPILYYDEYPEIIPDGEVDCIELTFLLKEREKFLWEQEFRIWTTKPNLAAKVSNIVYTEVYVGYNMNRDKRKKLFKQLSKYSNVSLFEATPEEESQAVKIRPIENN